ncbi:MAG: tetratricopeptide repeat protein [Alphaproteobacteria bacterium]|nr:tetratricopeptide repeat protein [Alphaproteobacteria bacterium]
MKTKLSIFVGFLFAFISPALAETYVSTADVISQIEKSLVFDKSSRQQMDFYKKSKNRESKSDVKADNNKSGSGISIVVTETRSDNQDLREKERLAYNLVLIGQYEAAIELYKQVVAKEPRNSYAKFSLATVYQKIGQFRQAKNLYYQMLKDGADNQDQIVGNLLEILIQDTPQDATYLLSRLAVQNPDSANIMAYAAMAYNKSKNYDQAISFFQKAIKLDSDNIDYKYNLAVIYDGMEKYREAVELYSEVVRKAPNDIQSIPVDQVKNRLLFISKKV